MTGDPLGRVGDQARALRDSLGQGAQTEHHGHALDDRVTVTVCAAGGWWTESWTLASCD